MDSGIYAAYTGLLARTQALDTASNNLANTNTSGFRAQRDYFRGVLASYEFSDGEESQVSSAVNSYGVLGGSLINVGQGQISSTGNPLDLAIDGAGYFALDTVAGRRYTRDGEFMRSQDGTLVAKHGEAVLDNKGQKISLPSGSIQIAVDGTVSVSTPQGSQIAGSIGIFDFDPKDSYAEGTNQLRVRSAVSVTQATGAIEQGKLEGANQGAVQGTVEMMLIQRQAEMMQRALNVFNNDFNKAAAEELGRI